MCTGGRLIADLTLGITERPDVPTELEASLTTSTDKRWVVWAYKLARPADGQRYRPLIGAEPYPADATARCVRGRMHDAPDPACTCGFHAVSNYLRPVGRRGLVELEVALAGRVLAFEWSDRGANGVLFRAERQTVVRIHPTFRSGASWDRPPADPDGRLARVRDGAPTGSGPIRLDLPTETPPAVSIHDDVGLCVLTPAQRPTALVLTLS